MVSTGGNIRPQVGDVGASGVTLDQATITAGSVTTLTAGTVNVTSALTVSGGANLQNVSGFFWRGTHSSGITGLLSGVSCKGFMRMDMSGQAIYVAYWVSA